MRLKCLLLTIFVMVIMTYTALCNNTLNNDSEVKIFLNDRFLRQMDSWDGTGVRKSGWDLNKIGGSVLSGGYLQLNDTSSTLPVTASHDIEPIYYGVVNMDLQLRISGLTSGAYIELNNGIRFESLKGNLWLKTGVGNGINITSLSSASSFNIRLIMDYDAGTVDVYCNDMLKCSDVEFLNNVAADNVFISTGEAGTGTLVVPYIRIYRGYPIWDNATVSLSTTPVTYSFDKIARSFIYEGQVIMPTAANSSVSFKNGSFEVFKIISDTNKFYTVSGGSKSELYSYKANMWYILRAEFDYVAQTVDVKINGRYIKKNIPVSFDGVDSVSITCDNTNAKASYLKLFYDEEFDDYVPKPEPVSSSEYLIGMQSFPCFTEGTSIGWDWINDTPGRKPLLGWYDGHSPETADWTIKWMVEHGIDFQWFCWNGFGALNLPVQYTAEDPTIHDGYMNAKYSEYMKYGILWENSAVNVFKSDAEANKNHFLTNIAPYWIEYYFKDPRYIKIDGRPMIGIFSYEKILEAFGGTSEITEVIEDFRELCIKEGVGNPIIVLRAYFSYAYSDASTLKSLESIGCDALYLYGNAYRDYYQSYINKGLLNNISKNAPTVQYIPTFNANWDSFAWLGGTGFKLTKNEFKGLLNDNKTSILPNIKNNLGGDKKVIMMSTWDEFGEGHYMCPTEEAGFSYLDAIREVFIGDTHTDVVPTDAQKDRINNLYPSDRTTLVREKNVSKTIPSNAVLKCTYNGNKGYEMLSGTATNNNGKLKLRADFNGNISIRFNNLNEDINDVTHISLQIKNSGSAYQGDFYYTTNILNSFDSNKKINFGLKQNMSSYDTIVLPVSAYPQHWIGILDDFRFDFSTGMFNTIEIESIKLWSVPLEGDILINDGGRYNNRSFIENDGKLYVPVKWLKETDKISYYYNENTNVFTAKNIDGRIASAKVDTKEITIDKETWQTDNKSVLFENNEFYLSPTFVAYGLNNEVFSNISARTLTVNKLPAGNNNFQGDELLFYSDIVDGAFDVNPNIGKFTIGFNNAVEIIEIKINGDNKCVKNIEKVNDKTYNVFFDKLDEGVRYHIDVTVSCGEKTYYKKVIFTTGFDTEELLLHYDLTTKNTFNPNGLSIVDGGMYVPDHKIYYGPSNPRPGDLLFDFAKLDKVIVTAKASEKMDLIFYLMGDCVAGSNNVNYAAVTNDYVDDMPASEDYVTYEIDFSDKVASVLASNQTYKYVRQIAIQHGFGEMYISDIKFVPAGYKAQSSLLTAGFEMVKDFGKATESNISNADMPCEVSDISATLNACVNHSNKPVSISLVSALYDGDKLIKVVSNTQRLASGEKITEPMVATIEDVPVGANYIVKGFLWNNFEPIATNYTLYHTK